MVRQTGFSFWRHMGMILGLSIVLMHAEVSWAARQYHRHYHRHDTYSSSIFLGFRYFGAPYVGYANGSDAYNPYAPGEHRRFPDFRLPAFFAYPGALGKGEVPEQAPGGKTQHDGKKNGR